MTNFEKITSMTVNELADWLNENLSIDDSVPIKYFDSIYCKDCQLVISHSEYFDRDVEMSYCEAEGRCKYFPEIEDIPDFREMCRIWLEADYMES